MHWTSRRSNGFGITPRVELNREFSIRSCAAVVPMRHFFCESSESGCLTFITREEPMVGNLEKRQHIRCSTKGSISLFSKVWASKQIKARLVNIGEQGICFTTDKKLVPGTTILCRRSNDHCLDPDDGEECRLKSINVLTVKWCQESSHKKRQTYTVGANLRPHGNE